MRINKSRDFHPTSLPKIEIPQLLIMIASVLGVPEGQSVWDATKPDAKLWLYQTLKVVGWWEKRERNLYLNLKPLITHQAS
jgi:hypothetical protein